MALAQVISGSCGLSQAGIGNTQTAGRQVTIASRAILNFASTDAFGNDVYLNYIIPEPRAELLGGLGLLILLRRRR